MSEKKKVPANRKQEKNAENIFGMAVLVALVAIVGIIIFMSGLEESVKLEKDFVDYEIEFKDKNFEAGIIEVINSIKKTPITKVMASDALRVTSLYIIGDFYFDNDDPYKIYEIEYHGDETGYNVDTEKLNGRCQITTLEDIVHFKNLTHFELNFGYINDLSPVAELENLQELWLNNNQISTIDPLVGNTTITKLNLGNNQVSDVSILTFFTQLTYLSFYSNDIVDIAPLANIYPTIDYINLADNPVKDWNAIKS